MRHLHERVVGAFEAGSLERGAVAVDGCPVTACDRARQLEAVLDRARHQRHERLRRCARFVEEPGGGAVERDEEVGCDRRARVVGGAPVVPELEGAGGRGGGGGGGGGGERRRGGGGGAAGRPGPGGGGPGGPGGPPARARVPPPPPP